MHETIDDRLADWVEAMHPILAGLQDFLLPEDFPMDFSAHSLDELETVLLDSFTDATAVQHDIADNDQGFTMRAAGYVGETLMRVGGGAWTWDKTFGPLATLDPALGLQPVAPLVLLAAAAERRSGHMLSDTLHALSNAVTARRNTEPGWSPVKHPTPALDPDALPPDRGTLAAWRQHRESRFPAWVADHTGYDPALWDFSVDSLDRLERLVQHRLSTEADFEKPENQEFVDGAIWYLGETIVRRGNAQWHYIEGERNEDNEWIGHPYIRQIEPPNDSVVPELTLMNVAELHDPGALRSRAALFED